MPPSETLSPAWTFRPGPDVAINPPSGLRLAQSLAKTAVAHALTHVQPGMTERDIERLVSDHMLAGGAEGIWTISNVMLGENARVCFPTSGPTDQAAADRDVLIVDLHPIAAGGFWGDCTRSTVVGEYSEAEVALRDLEAIHYESLATCRPGMEARDLFERVHRRMKAEGFILLDLLSNIGHSLAAGGAYQQGYIDAGNATPMWGAWAIEPFGLRGEVAVKVEDVVWFGRETCTIV